MSAIGRILPLLPLLLLLGLAQCGDAPTSEPPGEAPDEPPSEAPDEPPSEAPDEPPGEVAEEAPQEPPPASEGPSLHEQMGWAKTDPLAWLEMLKTMGEGKIKTILVPAPGDWLREEHLEAFMARIDDDTPAASVVTVMSSYIPFDKTSTVGNEAMFLLHAFREGRRYPAGLCSVYYFRPDPAEYRTWWAERAADR